MAISQEEVQAEKERLKAIDARPVKKVAEAKARKQKRVAVSSWRKLSSMTKGFWASCQCQRCKLQNVLHIPQG